MNILNGARLVNRTAALGTVQYSMATAVATGAAVSMLSIANVIQGKDDIQNRKLLISTIAKVRKIAFKAHRKEKESLLQLSEAEAGILEMVVTGAKTLVMSGLASIGTWFISTLMAGISSVVVPAFNLIVFASRFALRAVLFNPWVLGTLAAASSAYVLYRKFSDKVEEPEDNSTRKVHIPLSPGGTVEGDQAKTYEPSANPKQGFSPAQQAPSARELRAQAPTSQDMPTVQGAVNKGKVNGFQVFAVPAASTATAAPTEVLDSKGKKRDKVPFGLLNNNPGNIEFRNQEGATQWKTSGGKVSRFAKFSTQEEGLYQIGRQLQLYDSRGINTINKMINTYAPSSENNTAGYIQGVVDQSGYAADKPVDMTDLKLVSALIRAIVRAEVGTSPYTQGQYDEAAKRSVAFRGNKYQDKSYGLQIPTYGRLSSTYGTRLDPVEGKITRKHKGIDIAAPKGTPVYAASDGKAKVQAGTKGGYGNLLDILGDPYNTRYAHLDGFEVTDGAQVSKGELVARVGNTGRSTGAHLHFEVRDKQNNDVDPATVMSLPAGKIEKAQVVALPSNTELQVVRRNGQLVRLDK